MGAIVALASIALVQVVWTTVPPPRGAQEVTGGGWQYPGHSDVMKMEDKVAEDVSCPRTTHYCVTPIPQTFPPPSF